MSNPEAEKSKVLGNAAIQKNDFNEAFLQYTNAIKLDSTQATYYTNRALALNNLGKHGDALKDAEKAIELAPAVMRGYQRKAQALHGLQDYPGAIEAYQAALQLDPSNAQLKAGFEESLNAAKKSQYGDAQKKQMEALQEIFATDPVALCKSIPDIAHLATENSFCNKLLEIQRDFSKISNYMQTDEKVMQFISVAMQYQQISKMSTEERDALMKREQERAIKQQQKEDEERDRKRKEEKERKEAAAKKAKEEEDARLTTDQKEALKIKDEANALYNAKKYPEALALYDQAIEKDPTNINFYNNKAACYFTTKDYKSCIDISLRGVEVGQANHAPYDKIALAQQRVGNSYLQLGQLEDSIAYLKQSLLNDRNSKTLQLQKQAEKQLDENKKKAYINPELSAKAKEEGNDFFKKQQFPEAVKAYSEAILRDPSNHVNYSNRAATYIKLLALPEALKDADICIELNPKFAKGYLRKGTAQYLMKEYKKCLETYQIGIELEPNNKELIEGIQKAVSQLNKGQDEESVRRNVENDPEVQNILRDPIMRQVLDELRTDPKKAQAYLKDPHIRSNLDKLVSAGVVSFQ